MPLQNIILDPNHNITNQLIRLAAITESMEDERKGVCILSFDSGDSGSYSQFLIIKRYMRRLAAELGTNEEALYPADYFDLMGGVGLGGLAAFMMGQLRMTVEEAEKAFLTITSAVFPYDPNAKAGPETNTRRLKIAIEKMLEGRKIPVDAKMYDKSRPPEKCKVAVYAATSTNVSRSRPFRTYTSRGTKSNLNPTIVEALCATISIPSFFSPVKIGPHMREETFVGGAVGGNNPTRDLLKEAATLFGNDTRVAQIVSLGAGRSRTLSLDSMDPTKMASHMLKSLMMDCETAAAELSSRLFNVDAYVRLNVPGDMENARMDDWSGLAAIESQTSTYLETTEVTHDIALSLRYLLNRVGTVTLGQINYSSTTKLAVKSVPDLSPHYILRQKEWVTLVHHLVDAPSSTQKVLSITGMAGCGKTQLVSHFLQEKSTLYQQTIFVDAGSVLTLQSDLQAWSQSLGTGHEQDVWEDALRVLASEAYGGKWVLILDNADDPRLDLSPFIPNCYHGTVIITSRNRDVGDLANTHHLELGEMNEDEAFSTLLKAAQRQLPMSPDEMESAHTLAKQLGYLAVALVQAGTYCYQLSSNTQLFTFTQYAALFTSQRAELMKKAQPHSLDSYALGAYAAFDLSYNAIPQRAKDFLHLISSFDYPSISLAIYAAASAQGFGDTETLLPRPEDHGDVVSELEMLLCPDGKWSETQAHKDIRLLRSFSLISASSTANMVFVHLHPLVHAWARDILVNHSRIHQRMATQVLTSCGPRIELYRYLLPHMYNAMEANTPNRSHVNDQFIAAVVLRELGHYDKAEELFTRILEMLRQAAMENKEGYLNVTQNLAKAYSQHGKWNDAELLELEVLKQRRRLQGKEHPHTIIAAANLAVTYNKQGHYREAEMLELEVLEQRRRLVGRGHSETILAAANLAGTYRNQGRYGDAEVLELEVLEQRRGLLGQEHPDTILAAADLAGTYRHQGRYREAEVLELKVLEQLKGSLGRENPHTIRVAANLAITYTDQGRYGEAEVLELEVLEQRKGLLGEEHPDTILAAANLAVTYQNLGHYGKAEVLELKVLEQRRRLLGREHPDTIVAAANLAVAYSKQGRYGEAEVLQLETMEQSGRVLGWDHPSFVSAAANLAVTYSRQGRHNEAETLKLDALNRRTVLLGQDHPETIRAAANLAVTYSQQGRHREAEVLELEVLERRRRLLGRDHPDTIQAAADLAGMYGSQRRYGEAEALELGVMEQWKKLLGKEHPSTLFAMSNLAVTYANQREWWKAAPLLFDVVSLSLLHLGQKHPSTKQALSDLVLVLSKLGMTDAAEDIKELFL